MALARYKDLCIDVGDGRVSGEFWSTVLGWRLEMHDDGDAHLRDDDGRIQAWLNVVPEPKTVKNRVHIDVNAESMGDIVAGLVCDHFGVPFTPRVKKTAPTSRSTNAVRRVQGAA